MSKYKLFWGISIIIHSYSFSLEIYLSAATLVQHLPRTKTLRKIGGLDENPITLWRWTHTEFIIALHWRLVEEKSLIAYSDFGSALEEALLCYFCPFDTRVYPRLVRHTRRIIIVAFCMFIALVLALVWSTTPRGERLGLWRQFHHCLEFLNPNPSSSPSAIIVEGLWGIILYRFGIYKPIIRSDL